MRMKRPIRAHCSCGSSIVLQGFNDRDDQAMVAVWRGFHFGPEHSECSGDEAKAVRTERHRPKVRS